MKNKPTKFNRRSFLSKTGMAMTSMAVIHPMFSSSLTTSTPKSALIFDAMGEIRNVYTPSLIKEILKSGLNAITITLCDPKTFENDAVAVAQQGITEYDKYINDNPDLFIKALRASDVDTARRAGKLAIFYLFQNSTQFGRNLSSVDRFYDMGVRSSQITYNYQNWAGAGCKERTNAGLTHFGIELVRKMNEKGMLIDLSHANMVTMADTIKASLQPVIISHTTCRALNENERNTTDENMKLLADRGGVVGMCQMRPFISNKREGAYELYIDHILHAINIAGEDHVCIGSDRDHRVVEMTDEYIAELKAEEGDNFHAEDWPLYMDELNGPRRMEVIWSSLKSRNLSETAIEKVMGLNVYRLYKEVIG
ncbi:MAG: membrane dipeptidase [Cyclobacteriaceae bacterium]